MSDLSLSKAVRSNLLSLQSTAASMSKTQSRLATGLKVNSALDNPSNFFTASALNSRASDMSNLLDSMASGIKTIEAADNGLKSITKTVESMQSTLRQARQDKSFKSQSFTLDPAATGQLRFSGGAVGSSPVGVPLGSGNAVQSTLSATGDFYVPIGEHAQLDTTFAYSGNAIGATSIDFTVMVDNTTTIQISIDAAMLGSIGDGDDVVDDEGEFSAAINASLLATGEDDKLEAFSGINPGELSLLSATDGDLSSVEILAVSPEAQALGIPSTGLASGVDSQTQFTISNGSATANITLTQSTAHDAASARSEIAAQLQTQGVTGITVGGSGNRIDLAGAADGSNSITVGGAQPDWVFGTAPGITPGAPGGLSVDALVTSINGSTGLKDKVRASNDNSKLRIENLSTEALTVGGVAADGEIAGGSGTVEVGGNDVRANLVKQFNELRDQLDKFADDASFNGINLLRGDKLKLTFNETGTSTIEIQGKDTAGMAASINNASLGIDEALGSDFDADVTLDARLDGMKGVLDTLRSQSSAFGSNLSVVENRQDFTKSMIDTLDTGAANLTLADTNEEAANLLALQTRQQLSSTALSMASQADQAVLRLF